MLLEVPLEELPDEYAVNLLDLRPFQCVVVASPVLVRDVFRRGYACLCKMKCIRSRLILPFPSASRCTVTNLRCTAAATSTGWSDGLPSGHGSPPGQILYSMRNVNATSQYWGGVVRGEWHMSAQWSRSVLCSERRVLRSPLRTQRLSR